MNQKSIQGHTFVLSYKSSRKKKQSEIYYAVLFTFFRDGYKCSSACVCARRKGKTVCEMMRVNNLNSKITHRLTVLCKNQMAFVCIVGLQAKDEAAASFAN